ncbi:MAG: hypothetical protein KKA19_09625 [Candidatus Margulisbacteria bacterium]|nr:hypothetical protein [Candidatus Margulisiibacteriota bacterium]
MNRQTAVSLFLAICIVLAILLLTKMISSPISGSIFALALIIFGIASKGFTNK